MEDWEKSKSHEDVAPRLMLTNPLLKCCPLEVKVEFTQRTFKLWISCILFYFLVVCRQENKKKLLYTSLCPGLCDPQEHASLLLDWFVWLEDWALGVGEPDAVHSGAQVFKKQTNKQMWPLFCLALMIWKESKSNNSRWKRMKIIKPYWHHTSQTSHSKLFKNYFPFFFNLFFSIYYFSVLCFVTASLWVCKSSLLIYLLSFFPFSMFHPAFYWL